MFIFIYVRPVTHWGVPIYGYLIGFQNIHAFLITFIWSSKLFLPRIQFGECTVRNWYFLNILSECACLFMRRIRNGKSKKNRSESVKFSILLVAVNFNFLQLSDICRLNEHIGYRVLIIFFMWNTWPYLRTFQQFHNALSRSVSDVTNNNICNLCM